jgi:hypothetical protein
MGETSSTARPSNWHRLWSKWHRVWPGLVPFAHPVIYYAIIGSSVHYLLPLDQTWPHLEVENFKHEGLDLISNDMHGRFLFGSATALARFVSLAAIIIALRILFRELGSWKKLTFAFVGAALVGMSLGYAFATQDPSVLRIVYAPLQVAENAGVTSRGTLEKVIAILMTSMCLGGVAITVLTVAASAIAIRAGPGELTVDRLRQRMFHFQLIISVAAVLLIFIVLSQKLLLAWLQGLMTSEAAKPFAVLANGYAGHAGVSATIVIACASLPAIVSLNADMRSAAAAATKNGLSTEREWLRKNQLEFATAAGFLAATTTAAPMLTSPIVDILRTLLGS